LACCLWMIASGEGGGRAAEPVAGDLQEAHAGEHLLCCFAVVYGRAASMPCSAMTVHCRRKQESVAACNNANPALQGITTGSLCGASCTASCLLCSHPLSWRCYALRGCRCVQARAWWTAKAFRMLCASTCRWAYCGCASKLRQRKAFESGAAEALAEVSKCSSSGGTE